MEYNPDEVSDPSKWPRPPIPMTQSGKAPWDVSLTAEDYKKLLKGFWPTDMDDKWVLGGDMPDSQGNTVIHICRSWTKHEQITLVVTANGKEAKITEITWDNRENSFFPTEKEAKRFATLLCRRFTECELSAVRDEDVQDEAESEED